MPSGTSPTRRLLPRSSCSIFSSLASSPGMAPMRPLWLTSSTVRLVSIPSSGGMQDLSPVFMRMISSSVRDMLAMEAGRQPPKSLLASTSTDAGELPTLSGIWKRRRLELRKMASSGRSKSSRGTGPSKSLNRRSRYRRLGIRSTTSGKAPTRRLLLTSSSWRRCSFSSDRGTTPQKRLELTWNTARSVSSPSSSGRCPARSAWLRSTEATTTRCGSSCDGEQKTPS
uniref:Uncharacterized protein n=1 Tax=Oryza brachyantha TaxID=4533 RepID=J3L1J5_ORYBR